MTYRAENMDHFIFCGVLKNSLDQGVSEMCKSNMMQLVISVKVITAVSTAKLESLLPDFS